MSDYPQRKVELVLKVGADTFRDLQHALNDLAYHAAVSAEAEANSEEPIGAGNGEGLSLFSTCGGPSFSWLYSVRADGLPHDAYFEAIKAKLAEEKREVPG